MPRELLLIVVLCVMATMGLVLHAVILCVMHMIHWIVNVLHRITTQLLGVNYGAQTVQN